MGQDADERAWERFAATPVPPTIRPDPGNGGRCGSRYPMTSDYAVIDEDANLLAYGFQRLPEAIQVAAHLESAAYVIERQTVREIVWDLAHERGRS